MIKSMNMKAGQFEFLRCPKSKTRLTFKQAYGEGILQGNLISDHGKNYPINNGIPDLSYPSMLDPRTKEVMNWYDNNFQDYDEFLPVTFSTFRVDEVKERQKMINELAIHKDAKVLETGAGTGRDSLLIAEKLGENGELHVTDLNRNILEKALPKLEKSKCKTFYNICNAIFLPYPDNYFDCYFHFGGFNTFSDKKAAFKEIARVVKKGGRVVVGDESMPPWLRKFDFGKILMNTNSHYKYKIPLKHLDPSSNNVKLKFIIGGVFYFISYDIGEKMPFADFNFEIPGAKGGSHKTRYFGKLEGVTEETKKLYFKAAQKSGKSLHKWLEEVVRNAAKQELKDA